MCARFLRSRALPQSFMFQATDAASWRLPSPHGDPAGPGIRLDGNHPHVPDDAVQALVKKPRAGATLQLARLTHFLRFLWFALPTFSALVEQAGDVFGACPAVAKSDVLDLWEPCTTVPWFEGRMSS